jgi:hypothetical protein
MLDTAAAKVAAISTAGALCTWGMLGAGGCVLTPLQVLVITVSSISVSMFSLRNDNVPRRIASGPLRTVIYIGVAWLISNNTVKAICDAMQMYFGLPPTLTSAPIALIGPWFLVWLGESSTGHKLIRAAHGYALSFLTKRAEGGE